MPQYPADGERLTVAYDRDEAPAAYKAADGRSRKESPLRTALREAIAHLEEDSKQSDVPETEQSEDRELIERLKSVLAKAMRAPTQAQASAAQLEAGNYRKLKRRFQGLSISIENRKGSTRSGIGPGGKAWRTTMQADYGYLRGTQGVDGDHIDCYIGPDNHAEFAYVVHQRKAGDWKRFDEDKVMLGYPTEAAARKAFLAHYDDSRFLGSVTAMSMTEFKAKARATLHKPRMIKALFLKAGQAPAPGLVLRESVDKRGRRTARWVRPGETAPKPRRRAAPASNEEKKARFAALIAGKSEQDRAALQAAHADGIAIPPAWTGVEYFGKGRADGKVARGRDAAGRVQYVESAEYRQRMIAGKHRRIAKSLTDAKMAKITQRLREKAKDGDEPAKVLYLICKMAFRIGGKGDGRAKVTAYGASNLLGRHAIVTGDRVEFDFPGKKGVRQQHVITDPVIAAMFAGVGSEESVFHASQAAIRARWKELGGEKVHDIRSFWATKLAREVVAQSNAPKTEKEDNAIRRRAAVVASAKLGNNPSESLRVYIDHRVFRGVAS